MVFMYDITKKGKGFKFAIYDQGKTYTGVTATEQEAKRIVRRLRQKNVVKKKTMSW